MPTKAHFLIKTTNSSSNKKYFDESCVNQLTNPDLCVEIEVSAKTMWVIIGICWHHKNKMSGYSSQALSLTLSLSHSSSLSCFLSSDDVDSPASKTMTKLPTYKSNVMTKIHHYSSLMLLMFLKMYHSQHHYIFVIMES